MRRLLALFVLLAGTLLIAAAPPALPPVQLPPMPSPAPTLFGESEPTILVYPFQEPSDLDPKYGQAVAQIYAQVLAQSGGAKVLAIPKTPIERVDYDTYAHIQHADYYISGYIQPIGQSAAIVSQVVDVAKDITVYSTTTQISDVQDVASQALNARTVIMQAAGIEHPDVSTESDNSSTPAPQATTNGASVSVTNVLGDLFRGRHGTAQAGPAATAAAKPHRGVIAARIVGNAQPNVLGEANTALGRALGAHFTVTTSAVASNNAAAQANTMCGMNRDNTIAGGVLDVTHIGGFHAHDSYTFTLNIYACYGVVLYTTKQSNDDYAKAIRDAVEQYYDQHPDNNG